MENYLVVHLHFSPLVPFRDIIIAVLDQEGYDSFEETPTGLKAYILAKDFDPSALENLAIWQQQELTWQYHTEKLDTLNWNEEWERNYQPVFIEDRLHIRAPFHPAMPGYQHEIVIEPKMSFGTGHHQTTRLMATLMFSLSWPNQTVLDMGTGTGVLAILAEKLGAKNILAIDNFEWAAENTKENAQRNNCTKVEARLGDADSLQGHNFNVVLANINRNVLLKDMPVYGQTLEKGGSLLLSGFFESDFAKINAKAVSLGLRLEKKIDQHNWQCCWYIKTA
jgi:ribosomal protein L11 methyltransferase